MRLLEILFVLVLIVYPLRHVTWGVDLWDTGYNYANLTYTGLRYMDDMWFFATYLANVFGHLLTLLPFGGTLVGMNVYTGLVLSALALMGYFFCTRQLQIPATVAFIGEYAALSLSWSPSAVLYHYLTYLFFTAGVMLLYMGLVKERRVFLVLAGICLGANIFVRFPNLTEAALIVTVWAYAVVRAIEKRREEGKEASKGFLWKNIWQNTLWCLLGYVCAVGAFLLFLQVRYGISEYVSGVLRLFAMTETASDYQSTSMLKGLIFPYYKLQFYNIGIAVYFAAGAVIFFGRGLVLSLFEKKTEANEKSSRIVRIIVNVLTAAAFVLVLAALVLRLYRNDFFSGYYFSYDSVYWPAALFLFLTMAISAWNIVRPGSKREERLMGGMLILLLMLSCLGSNNNIYPAINNLYLAAPVTLWQCTRFFFASAKDWKARNAAGALLASAKGVLGVVLAIFLLQAGLFGTSFVFAEATGVQNIGAEVTNVPVLKNVKMSGDKAAAIEGLAAFLAENELDGSEAVFYGKVPSLSFYLELPPAINVWPDLDSYGITVLERDLDRLAGKIDAGEAEKPIVIGSMKLLENGAADPKWALICDFMAARGYALTYGNDLFAVWTP